MMQDKGHKLTFITAYSQFYIADKAPPYYADDYSPAATDSEGFWTTDALTDKLAVEKGILGVCIGTYSYVTCEVTLMVHRPDETDFEAYDQIVEGSLEINSGVLQLLDCPDSMIVLELTVQPGWYRVRVKTVGLDSILDEEAKADDIYLIEIWPEAFTPRKVLKRYGSDY